VWLTWSTDIHHSIERGFPLINLALTNLSLYIHPDYFIYVVHPLNFISLIVLVYMIIIKLCQIRMGKVHNIFLILLILTIFLATYMSVRMFFYSNNHVLFAIFLLLALDRFHYHISKPDEQINPLYLPFLFCVIIVSRMEGYLFAIVIFSLCMLYIKDTLHRKRLLLAVTLPAIPIVLMYVMITWNKGFVSSEQYIVMLFLHLGMYICFGTKFFSKLLNHADRYVFLVLYISAFSIIFTMIFINSNLMIGNIKNFIFLNIFSMRWGVANYFVFLSVVFVLYLKSFSVYKDIIKSDRNVNIFLHAFIFSFFLILATSFFRKPLHSGAFDSANRMYFHFLPLIFVWIGYSLSRITQIFKNNSTLIPAN
jgi:hypothetical protein